MDTDEKKAEALGTFFSSVFSHEPAGDFDLLPNIPCQKPMKNVEFKIEDIKLRLSKIQINKSPGPDLIHPRLLYETRDQIAYPLKRIFECSYKTKQLPADWKSANISAIYKKGKKSDVGNYRPVSLTSISCKIMESIIRDSIMKHFLKNRLFSKNQFGFIKGRSTVLQLLKVISGLSL